MCKCNNGWTVYDDEIIMIGQSDTDFFFLIVCDTCGGLMKAYSHIDHIEDYTEEKKE